MRFAINASALSELGQGFESYHLQDHAAFWDEYAQWVPTFIPGFGAIGRVGSALRPLAAVRAASPDRVGKTASAIIKLLGNDARVITNRSGDKIFLNRAGNIRVRFDINNPSPHINPHSHVEQMIKGRWQKSGPIYPIDVLPF